VNPGKYVSADFPTEEYVRSDSFSFSPLPLPPPVLFPSSPTLKYLIPAPLPSEPPLRYDSDPPSQASALHCDARNNTRTRRSGGSASPLRCASPFRSTSYHSPRYCFFALRSKKGTEIKDRLWYGGLAHGWEGGCIITAPTSPYFAVFVELC
jgi:hypothetical protein